MVMVEVGPGQGVELQSPLCLYLPYTLEVVFRMPSYWPDDNVLQTLIL